MSDYANKLSQLAEKKKKLIDQEKKIIEERKKYIADLAEKHNIISATDEMIAGLFSEAAKEMTSDSETAKRWHAIGEKFRNKSKTKISKIKKDKSFTN